MKILYASFCGFNILGVLDLRGVKISVFRLTSLVIVTTTTVLPQVIAKVKKLL